MKSFINSRFVKEVSEITNNMYHQGWDERNGGNISYLIDEECVREYFPKDKYIRDIEMGFTADEICRNKYFLVTGTGKYFKNVIKDPEANLGLVKIDDNGHIAHLLWGYRDGGKFTSEFPAHLMSHAVRLKVNPNNRVIMHTHPTYTICMGACLPTDEVIFTRKLWKSNTEAVVVFPEGNHGIYGAGNDIDEAFGLIETVEKTAQIYMLTLGHVVNEIPDEVIIGLAKLWNLKMMPGVIEDK